MNFKILKRMEFVIEMAETASCKDVYVFDNLLFRKIVIVLTFTLPSVTVAPVTHF
jgi:hypothetical protein